MEQQDKRKKKSRMLNVGRTSHDRTPFSISNQKLERRLEQEIKLYINHQLLSYLRSSNDIGGLAAILKNYSNLILPYVKTCYRLGGAYVSKITSHEVINSSTDDYRIGGMHREFYNDFAKKINALIQMQQTENRRAYQIIAHERDRIADELSSDLSWTCYNQGVKCKGIEFTLSNVPRPGLVSMKRNIRTADLKRVLTQKVFVDRVQTRERTHALESPEEAALSFVFITQHDELVCEICRGLEFQSWAPADPDFPDIPDDTHPNCRCILMLAEETDEGGTDLRQMLLEETALTSAILTSLTGISGGEEVTLTDLRKARAAARKKKKKT